MNLKSGIVEVAGKSSCWSLRDVLKGGTSFPGRFTMKVDSEVLNSPAKGYETIIVAGTDGKTVTTALTVEMLKKKHGDILTDLSGPSMRQGIVTVFLAHRNEKAKKKIAVLEVDEANVKMVTKLPHPSVFVLTNISCDQTDRYGEIRTACQKIADGIKLAPDVTIIANGDASIFSLVELPSKKIFYGFKLPDNRAEDDFKALVSTDGALCPRCDHVLHYHKQIYANLGDFSYPNCSYHRPELTYSINQIIDQTSNSLKFKMGGGEYSIDIGGTYNVYNALAAYSVAREFDLSEEEVAQSFVENKRIFGRQGLTNYVGKEVDLILVENLAGLDEVLYMLSTERDNYSLVALLDANHTGGIDTSWIWDADYESLNKDKIKEVLVGGKRWHDMDLRLETAEFNPDPMITATNSDVLLDETPKLPTKKVYILATYAAMLSLCKTMGEERIIRAGMQHRRPLSLMAMAFY